MPRVTVITATYNWATVLPYSIASVLDQTFTDFELLVVGDGCTDESAQVVSAIADPRVHWCNLPGNVGHQYAPNNEGIRRANGEVIALDASNGAERWRAQLSAEVVARPTVGSDTVYVRSNDGRVYALDIADGKQRWINDRSSVPLLSLRGNATPRLAGELLLNASDAGKVSALRASDGASAWEQNLASGEGRTEVERLGDVDGDLRIDGDVVHDVELPRISARTSNSTEHCVRCAINNAHFVVHSVDHIDQRLLAIGRECQLGN